MYEGISCFYDSMTEDIDYDRVARFVDRAVRRSPAYKAYKKRGETPILLDAACGTGSVLCHLRNQGYDCIGLDISEDMLERARENIPYEDVLWICQDMCRMDLFGSVTGICCMTDGVNHVTSPKALARFFALAHNFLDPGGILVFDVLTEEHFTRHGAVLNCFADYETVSCFWTGRYSTKTGRCVYDISCFMQQEDGLYERTDDRVTEQVWSEEVLYDMLCTAGFVKIQVFPGDSLSLGQAAKHRLYYICEKE